MRGRRHKYLNEIGVPSSAITTFATTDRSALPGKRIRQQRRKYGFDVRETYCLDVTIAGWLYSHLRMYLAASSRVIDHSVKVCDIPVLRPLPLNRLHYIENGQLRFAERYYEERIAKGVPRNKAIRLALQYLKTFLLEQSESDGAILDTESVTRINRELEKSRKAAEAFSCALRILAVIHPWLGW